MAALQGGVECFEIFEESTRDFFSYGLKGGGRLTFVGFCALRFQLHDVINGVFLLLRQLFVVKVVAREAATTKLVGIASDKTVQKT